MAAPSARLRNLYPLLCPLMPAARVPRLRCLGTGATSTRSPRGTPTRHHHSSGGQPVVASGSHSYPSPSFISGAAPSSRPDLVSTLHHPTPSSSSSRLYSSSSTTSNPTTKSSKMPTYIVSCKDEATPDQVASAKQAAKDQGGEIVHELDIIKGFSVKFPDDAVTTLDQLEHVKAVEADGVAKTC